MVRLADFQLRSMSRQVLVQAWREFRTDNTPLVAAGVAFYVLIALFPAVAVLFWAGRQLLGPHETEALLPMLSGVVPDSAYDLLRRSVTTVEKSGVEAGGKSLSFVPYLGIVLLLWSANSGTKALFNALNVVYDTEERRGFLRFTMVTMVFTVGTIAFLLASTGIVLLVPGLVKAVADSSSGGALLSHVRWIVLLLILPFGLSALYRYAPNRPDERAALVTLGSLLATLLYILLSFLFSWFVARFASLAATYGSLSSVVAFLLWLWLSFIIVLGGAELDATRARGGASKKTRERIGHPRRF